MERKNADKTFLKGNKNNGKNISSNPINIPQKTKQQNLIQELGENVNIYNPKKFSSNSWNNRLEKRFNDYYLA
jgi:hypothetical protein